MPDMTHDHASFRSMIDGTQEDWDIIAREQKEFAPQNGKRILDHLKLLGGDYGGFPVDRLNHYNPMLLALANLDIPVVAAVNGPAAGVGCSFALSGDFAIAGKSAYFLQAFVNIGLVPDGGSSWLLPRLVGLPRATQVMRLCSYPRTSIYKKVMVEEAAE